MTTIYLIRHAEAEGNLYRRAQGQYNSLITDNGYRQISALSTRFEKEEIDEVWSSDLFRTMTTADAIVVPHKKTLHTHAGLREIHMGQWEDKTWGQLHEEDPEGMAQFISSSQHWQAEGGESFQALSDRISQTMCQLAKENQGKTIAVFSHGLAIRQFLEFVQQTAPEEWGSSPHGDNTSVTKLLWDGEAFSVEFSSDNSHLSEEISTFARQKWWRKESGGSEQDRNLWFRQMEGQQEEKDYQSALLEVWGAELPRIVHEKRVFLGFYEEKLVGWVALADDGELLLLHLKQYYRNDRLGLQFLGQAISEARKKDCDRLFLRHRNPESLGFFKAFGFEETEGRFEKYIGYEKQ